MRDFFNTAVAHSSEDVRNKFKDFLIELVKHATLHSDTTDDAITNDDIEWFGEEFFVHGRQSVMPVMAVPYLNLLLTMYSDNSRVNEIADRMKAVYTWMPFLWFHGYHTTNRADDPRDGFEIGARRITDRYYHNRFSELQNLHGYITSFTRSNDISAFEQAIATVNGLMSQRDTSDYDPFLATDWEEVPPKKDMCQFRIRAPAPQQAPTLHQVPDKELRKRRQTKVNGDYSCKKTAETIKKHFHDGSYYTDNNNIDEPTVWNLTHFNLVTTRQIINDVKKIEFLQYPDWRLWYSEHYKSYGDFYLAKNNETQCVVFGDFSFAIGIKDEFHYKLIDSSLDTDLWGIATVSPKFKAILIVDRDGHPVMVRIHNVQSEYGDVAFTYNSYESMQGYWKWTRWYKVMDEDFAFSPLSLANFAPNLISKYLSDEFEKNQK